jgi:hypothetical protein
VCTVPSSVQDITQGGSILNGGNMFYRFIIHTSEAIGSPSFEISVEEDSEDKAWEAVNTLFPVIEGYDAELVIT